MPQRVMCVTYLVMAGSLRRKMLERRPIQLLSYPSRKRRDEYSCTLPSDVTASQRGCSHATAIELEVRGSSILIPIPSIPITYFPFPSRPISIIRLACNCHSHFPDSCIPVPTDNQNSLQSSLLKCTFLHCRNQNISWQYSHMEAWMQLRMKNLLTFFIRLRHVSLTYMHKTENWK